jgi:hypothetical protein
MLTLPQHHDMRGQALPGPTGGGHGLVLAWWALYLLLSPFYVFKSGNPQPADLLLVLLSPLVLIIFAFRIHVQKEILLLALSFLGWIMIVNIFWWAQYYNDGFLLASSFYLYNMLVFFAVIAMHSVLRERFINVSRMLLFALIGIQFVVIVLGLDAGGIRRSGTFNNPNQLGYWCLLIACCVVVLRGRDRLTTGDTIALLAAWYLAAESLSRGAMYAFLVLAGIAFAFRGINMRGLILIAVAAALGAIALSANPSRLPGLMDIDVYERFNRRVEMRSAEDQDEVSGRGYDRIFEYPQHLLFGAGEGEHSRFRDAGDTEFHSTFGVLLFHYGAIGSVLFGLLLVSVFRRAPWGHVLLLVPIGLYGLTHQGLRFTLFWIFLGLVVAMSERARQGDVGSARQRPATWLTSGREGMVRRGG